MTSWSDDGICPNCGSNKYSISFETKPFDMTDSVCLDCGFHTFTFVGISDLEDLNGQRSDFEKWDDKELKPLDKPKKQTEWAKENIKDYLSKEYTPPDPHILVEYFHEPKEDYQVDKYTLTNFVEDFNSRQSHLRQLCNKYVKLYIVPRGE